MENPIERLQKIFSTDKNDPAPPVPDSPEDAPLSESSPGPKGGAITLASAPAGGKIGDRDGEADREERDFMDKPEEDDPNRLEKLRVFLVPLVQMAFTMARRKVPKIQAEELVDQIIQCAYEDDSFAEILDFIPASCMAGIALSAYMIYTTAPIIGGSKSESGNKKPGVGGVGAENTKHQGPFGSGGSPGGIRWPDNRVNGTTGRVTGGVGGDIWVKS